MADQKYSAELIETLKSRPVIKTVYFDKEGNHYFNAFKRGDVMVVGNRSVEGVSREEILKDQPSKEPKAIEQMNMDELKAYALKDAEKYPQDEWTTIKKKADLLSYIQSKN